MSLAARQISLLKDLYDDCNAMIVVYEKIMFHWSPSKSVFKTLLDESADHLCVAKIHYEISHVKLYFYIPHTQCFLERMFLFLDPKMHVTIRPRPRSSKKVRDLFVELRYEYELLRTKMYQTYRQYHELNSWMPAQ